jgi:hypothetical protein
MDDFSRNLIPDGQSRLRRFAPKPGATNPKPTRSSEAGSGVAVVVLTTANSVLSEVYSGLNVLKPLSKAPVNPAESRNACVVSIAG